MLLYKFSAFTIFITRFVYFRWTIGIRNKGINYGDNKCQESRKKESTTMSRSSRNHSRVKKSVGWGIYVEAGITVSRVRYIRRGRNHSEWDIRRTQQEKKSHFRQADEDTLYWGPQEALRGIIDKPLMAGGKPSPELCTFLIDYFFSPSFL